MNNRSSNRKPFKFSSEEKLHLSLANWGSTDQEREKLRDRATNDIMKRRITDRARTGEK